MAVLPADRPLDLPSLQRATGRAGLRLAREGEFAPLFSDCELGAMPPFGLLYGMPLFVDPCLARSSEIFFRGGTHHMLVRMRFDDWRSVARPMAGLGCFHTARAGMRSRNACASVGAVAQ
jgi:Ala-tRNA(Pro) deacylase